MEYSKEFNEWFNANYLPPIVPISMPKEQKKAVAEKFQEEKRMAWEAWQARGTLDKTKQDNYVGGSLGYD